MTGVRFTELQSRPMAFLDFTSLTLDEFQQLVPPFEAAFHARMAAWCLDGKPRTARRFTIEFIPIKPLVATESNALGSYAGHRRGPSPDRKRPPSRGGFGL